MKHLIKFQLIFLITILSSCRQKETLESEKIGTYENVKKELKESETKELNPKANIDELEMEINNGGFNQYFINSGQNCFETLNELERNGKIETAKILKRAIKLINPKNLPQSELIEKLQKREVEELYDEKINSELNKLDELFFKYPDGDLRIE